MPVIYVENKPYEVAAGQNMLNACLGLGFNIPYFCWHPALGSVGACRLCAVKQFKDDNDTKGKIVMSCMTPANDGTRISINHPDVLRFRKAILEWLMVNHPHDCPVCDEGGECHLQDMTLMTGQVYRKHRYKKRTYRNQDLGPYVKHEMNRCIQCYRCVRFYRDYAGGHDLNVFSWHDNVYFGRHKDGTLESQFSGNLVEVCPTGVFTDKTLAKHYTRKWDLQTAPSICVGCGLGCNIIAGERYGTLRRVLNRYNSEINGYFLCDRGRFGYEFVNSDRRIKKALCRGEPVSKESAITEIAKIIKSSRSVIGIGSPRASLESNYALNTLVGSEKFYAGVSEAEYETLSTAIDILRNGPVRAASLLDVAKSDAVLVLGEDVSKSAPMLELALRQAVLNRPASIAAKLSIDRWNDAPFRDCIGDEKGPLFIASPEEGILDEIATGVYRGSPDDLAQLGFAVAHEVDAGAPVASGLENDARLMAKKIANDLKNARNPLVISGTACGSIKVLQAAANVTYALQKLGKKPQICFTVPSCNSVGLAMSGGKVLTKPAAETIIILENDIAERFFNDVKNIIVLDSLGSETTAKADYVLPAATFAESDGTFINNEGRAQRFFKVFSPAGDITDSWRWLRDIMIALGKTQAQQWVNFDGIIDDLALSVPVFEPILKVSPKADFRMWGQRIPRQAHRASGRTAISANMDVCEHKPADDPDSPLSFSMEGYLNQVPSRLITRFWSPGWNSVQAVTKYQREVGGPLIGGDPGVRLFEPKPSAAMTYFKVTPHSFISGT
jgi:NADH-quinone oxidoreductase subunit G